MICLDRNPRVIPMSISIDRAARELLTELCAPKKIGAYLSRLIYQEYARVQERQRLKAAINAACVPDPVNAA